MVRTRFVCRADSAKFSKRSTKGSICEFPLAIWIALAFFAFPLINLTFIGMASSCIFLTAVHTAQSASCSQTYKSALTAVKKQADTINASPLVKFAGLAPVAGFESSGIDLFIQATSVSGNSMLYGPNTELNNPADTASFIYEYKTTATYDIKPVINLAAVPGFSSIPGLGKPARISLSAHRSCEFPMGLCSADATTQFAGGVPSISLANLGLDSPGSLGDPSGTTWNHPSIYESVRKAGQKVLSETVLYVNANNSYWTPTKLNVPPGAKVWVDYTAEGAWADMQNQSYPQKNGGAGSTFDADGYFTLNQMSINNQYIPEGAMVAKLGVDGSPFLMGSRAWNKELNGSGDLYLGMEKYDYKPDYGLINGLRDQGQPPNLNYSNNFGRMLVRIVIAK